MYYTCACVYVRWGLFFAYAFSAHIQFFTFSDFSALCFIFWSLGSRRCLLLTRSSTRLTVFFAVAFSLSFALFRICECAYAICCVFSSAGYVQLQHQQQKQRGDNVRAIQRMNEIDNNSLHPCSHTHPHAYRHVNSTHHFLIRHCIHMHTYKHSCTGPLSSQTSRFVHSLYICVYGCMYVWNVCTYIGIRIHIRVLPLLALVGCACEKEMAPVCARTCVLCLFALTRCFVLPFVARIVSSQMCDAGGIQLRR